MRLPTNREVELPSLLFPKKGRSFPSNARTTSREKRSRRNEILYPLIASSGSKYGTTKFGSGFRLRKSNRFNLATDSRSLNSLLKVLFNFPSRYLFNIGLVVLFSLRWSLPPAWGCTLKQPDSRESPANDPHGSPSLRGFHPLWLMRLDSLDT